MSDKEYFFTGSVELRGASFVVTARDENEAKIKAMQGDWDHYEIETAECINTDIDVTSCRAGIDLDAAREHTRKPPTEA